MKLHLNIFLMYLVNSRIRGPPPAEKGKMLIRWGYCLLSLFSEIKHIFMKGLNWSFSKTKPKKETNKGQIFFFNSPFCLPRNRATCQTEPPSNTHTIQSDLQSNFFRASTCAQLMTCRTWNLLSLNRFASYWVTYSLPDKWNALAVSIVCGNCPQTPVVPVQLFLSS